MTQRSKLEYCRDFTSPFSGVLHRQFASIFIRRCQV